MGFFNDIIDDARPAPKSIGESFNTELQNSERPFDEELHPTSPVEEPEPAANSEDISAGCPDLSSRIFSRDVTGEVSPSRLLATERLAEGKDQKGQTEGSVPRREKPAGESSPEASVRNTFLGSLHINSDNEKGEPIRKRMSDPSSVFLDGDDLSTRLPDRDALASTLDPKTGSASERTSIEGQKSRSLPESEPSNIPVDAMAEEPVRRKPQPEPVEQANHRQFPRETRVEESAAPSGRREDQIGFEGDSAGLRMVEVEPRHQEPSREQRAVKLESPVEEEKDRDVSRTTLSQHPLAEDSLSPPPTPSIGKEQAEQHDAMTSVSREIALAIPPAEREMPEPIGPEPPSQPQVNIGRIEVIVEVSDPPAAEKVVKSGTPSQDLSSRYYLRRL